MTYIDAHGRPELVMHPDIKRGTATVRVGGDGDREPQGTGSIVATDERSQESPRGRAESDRDASS